MAETVKSLDGRQTKGERSKRHILSVIAKLAMTREISEITLADICEAAEVSTGAIYFHFKSRDDAVAAMIIDQVGALWVEPMTRVKNAPLEDVLEAIVTSISDFHVRKRRLKRAIQAVINSDPRAYQAWLDGRSPAIERLSQSIAAARAAEGLSTDEAAFLAYFVLGSIEDLSMDVFQWRNPTLQPFAADVEDWNAKQVALWRWAVLAPLPGSPRGKGSRKPGPKRR